LRRGFVKRERFWRGQHHRQATNEVGRDGGWLCLKLVSLAAPKHTLSPLCRNYTSDLRSGPCVIDAVS
jgi:hypothetical protein